MENLDKESTLGGYAPIVLPLEAELEGLVSGVDRLPTPSLGQLLAIWGQWLLDWVFLLPFAGSIVLLMRFAGGYRIDHVRSIRQRFREIARSREPMLICLNHLTFIDSALLMWAMASNFWYLRNFRCFSWNLPAGDFFKKKLTYRLVALFSKCIFIHRDGSRDHKYAVLGACRYLLARGEVVSIFPEGKRSRSGRFEPDKVTHGVGKILASLPNCRVLCVYIRGDKQQTWSNYPPRGSRLRISMELIRPHSDKQGRPAYHELTSQIANTLKRLEDQYFAEMARC